MKRASRVALGSFIILVSVVFCPGTAAQAQSRDMYTVSAKAGGINLISGKVVLQRKGVVYSQPLTTRDDFEAGDMVRTESDGRVEMLLNPGSYMRVSENSEFVLTDASLESIRLKLTKGSILIEAAGTGDTSLLTEVDTPQTRIAVIRKGLYRINVSPTGSTELSVYKGRAVVGRDSVETVKDGKRVVVTGGGQIEVAKFDRKEQDAFGFWSKQRAETLVAANRRLSDSVIYSAHSVFNNGWCARANCTAYSGLWVYDPYFGSRTFLPFYSRWSSPYGLGYSNGFGFSGDFRWYPLLNPTPGQSSNPGARVGKMAPPAPAAIDPTQAPPRRRMPDSPTGFGGLGEDRRRSAPAMPADMNEQQRSVDRYSRDRDFGTRSSGDFDRGSRQHAEPARPSSPAPSYSPPPSAPAPSIDRSVDSPRSKGSPAEPLEQ